jgi:hypothetical protein
MQTPAMIPGTLLPLKALLVDGWRVTARSIPNLAIAGSAIVASALVIALPFPFRDPGRFLLRGFAAVDQLIALFVVAVLVLEPAAKAPAPSLPIPALTRFGARGLGFGLGIATLMAGVVAAQLLGAALVDDLHIPDFTEEGHHHALPQYLTLLVSACAYGLVLAAWGQLLRQVLRPATALLALIVLAFSGFFVARMLQASPGLAPLMGVFPDLAALAPTALVLGDADPPLRLVSYVVLHLGMVWALAAVVSVLPSTTDGSVDGSGRGA